MNSRILKKNQPWTVAAANAKYNKDSGYTVLEYFKSGQSLETKTHKFKIYILFDKTD